MTREKRRREEEKDSRKEVNSGGEDDGRGIGGTGVKDDKLSESKC